MFFQQEDIRSYIDNSVKHGMKLSAFRRERIGGDSHGVSYWYFELSFETILKSPCSLKILNIIYIYKRELIMTEEGFEILDFSQ